VVDLVIYIKLNQRTKFQVCLPDCSRRKNDYPIR
jgi:hypothetical protein